MHIQLRLHDATELERTAAKCPDTRDYRALGLCPSSVILKNISFRKLDLMTRVNDFLFLLLYSTSEILILSYLTLCPTS
jgi:hypothetical protein